MRSCSILLVFYFGMTCFSYGQRSGINEFNSVINKELIQNSGMNRLSDIGRYTSNWSYNTIDGFHSRFANSLSGYSGQNWILQMNGVPVDINLFESKNINSIGVGVSGVDSIVFIDVPQIYNGQFVDAGLIDVKSREIKDGIEAYGHYMTGNEVGDPGPYRYTNASGGEGNVEKIGYDYQLGLAMKKGKWSQNLRFNRLRDAVADDLIVGRASYFDGYPRLLIHSYGNTISYKDTSGNHLWLDMNYSDQRDYLFENSIKRELPIDNRIFTVNAFYSKSLSTKTNMVVRGGNSGRKLWARENFRSLTFSGKQRMSFLNMELRRELQKGTSCLGLRLSNSLHGLGKHDSTLSLVSVYGSVFLNRGKKYSSSTDIYFTGNHLSGSSSIKLAKYIHYKLSSNSALAVNVAYFTKLSEEDSRILRSDSFGTHKLVWRNNKTKVFTGDIRVSRTVMGNLKLSVSGYYRNQKNGYMEQVMERTITEFNTPYMVDVSLDGQWAGVRFDSEFHHKKWSQKFGLDHRYYLEGDEAFTDEWRTVPSLRLHSSLSFRIHESFSIFLNYGYRSGSRWKLSTSKVEEIDNLSLLDISLGKWFLSETINVNLMYRNVFGDQEIYHPLGADKDMRFYVRILYNLSKTNLKN